MFNSISIFLIGKEFKVLAGKRLSNVFFLFIVYFITFLSIGFSFSMLENLKLRMDSPFVRFVQIEIPTQQADQKNMIFIDSVINLEDNKSQYLYNNTIPVYLSMIEVLKADGKSSLNSSLCQAVSDSDDFFKFLANDSSLFSAEFENLSGFENKYNVIVTEEFLYSDLGYNRTDSTQFINLAWGDTYKHNIPVRISAIVKQLPRDVKILLPKKLFYFFKNHHNLDPIPFKTTEEIYKRKFALIVVSNKLKTTDFQKCFNGKFIPNITSHSGYQQLDFDITAEDSLCKDSLIGHVKNISKPDSVFEYYRFSEVNNDNVTSANLGFRDYILVPFSELDSVSEFQMFAKKNPLNLTVNMEEVEAKKNFRLIDAVARSLAYLISLIAVILIFSFNLSLLMSHINRNKKNLGTLKAFGLSNTEVITIYSAVTFCMIFIAFLSSYFLLEVLGNRLISIFMHFSSFALQDGIRLYDSVNFVWSGLVFVLVPVLMVFIQLYRFLHNSTPGDLIYSR